MTPVLPFDYGACEPEIAEKLRTQASQIVARLKRHTVEMIAAGEKLKMLEPREFGENTRVAAACTN